MFRTHINSWCVAAPAVELATTLAVAPALVAVVLDHDADSIVDHVDLAAGADAAAAADRLVNFGTR